MNYDKFLNNPDFSSPAKIAKWMEDVRAIIIDLLKIVDCKKKKK